MARKAKYNFNKQELIQLYNECGKSAVQTAKKLGINEKTVRAYLNKFGVNTSYSKGNKRQLYNEDYFELIDTEDKAYWLGFLMADGCVYKGQDKYSYRLQINLSYVDIEQLNNFQNDIGSNYTITIKENNSKLIKRKENKEIALLKVNSTKMCKDLMQKGMLPKKTFNEHFPFIDESLYSHYIRGYFDGDGCISCNTSKNTNQWSFEIIGGMQSIVNMYDIIPVSCNLYRMESRCSQPLYKLSVVKIEDLLKLEKWLYSNANRYLVRKRKKFIEMLKQLSSHVEIHE